MNKEAESAAMRPLAKALTKSLENVRNLLRETCLRSNNPNGPLKLNYDELVTEMLLESLKIFDRLFAEFEFHYVSAMVPVKTMREYELQEMISVLFSETLQRALKMSLLTQDMVDDCDPALMFNIPRLAIVTGLLLFPNGPLSIDKPLEEMSEMFGPFRKLLHKIRELLWTLDRRELYMLEKLLCDNEQFASFKVENCDASEEFLNEFYNVHLLTNDYTPGIMSDVLKQHENEYKVRNCYVSQCNFDQRDLEERPSTSGYLISNTVEHDSIIALITPHSEEVKVESLPDHDSLEIITEAAATLSSILVTKKSKEAKKKKSSKCKKHEKKFLESPDDSGICTENTSLDRSPTLDSDGAQRYTCVCGQSDVPYCRCCSVRVEKTVSNTSSKSYRSQASPSTPNRTKLKGATVCRKIDVLSPDGRSSEEDSTSVDSSDTTSSFNSTCADDEELALALQAAEIANRNEVRSKFK